jgi:hypothetical protein
MFPLSSCLSAFHIDVYILHLLCMHIYDLQYLSYLQLHSVYIMHLQYTHGICQSMLLAADHALSSVAFAETAVWTFRPSQDISSPGLNLICFLGWASPSPHLRTFS